ncbi:hypothetical protein ACFQV4_28255 [Streptomyces thermocarboxydus]
MVGDEDSLTTRSQCTSSPPSSSRTTSSTSSRQRADGTVPVTSTAPPRTSACTPSSPSSPEARRSWKWATRYSGPASWVFMGFPSTGGSMTFSRSSRKKNAAGMGASPQSRRTCSQSTFSRRARAMGSTAPKSQWCSENAAIRPVSRSVGARTGIRTDSTGSSSARRSISSETGRCASSKMTSTSCPKQVALISQSSGGL